MNAKTDDLFRMLRFTIELASNGQHEDAHQAVTEYVLRYHTRFTSEQLKKLLEQLPPVAWALKPIRIIDDELKLRASQEFRPSQPSIEAQIQAIIRSEDETHDLRPHIVFAEPPPRTSTPAPAPAPAEPQPRPVLMPVIAPPLRTATPSPPPPLEPELLPALSETPSPLVPAPSVPLPWLLRQNTAVFLALGAMLLAMISNVVGLVDAVRSAQLWLVVFRSVIFVFGLAMTSVLFWAWRIVRVKKTEDT